MAGLLDLDVTVGIKLRAGAIHVPCQGGAGKDEVQLGQHLQVGAQGVDMGSGLTAQGSQDHLDLFLLGDLQLTDLVVQLDDGHGLDKEGRTALRLVVDHTADLVFKLGLDGNTVAAATHGDHRILQLGAVGVYDLI